MMPARLEPAMNHPRFIASKQLEETISTLVHNLKLNSLTYVMGTQ